LQDDQPQVFADHNENRTPSRASSTHGDDNVPGKFRSHCSSSFSDKVSSIASIASSVQSAIDNIDQKIAEIVEARAVLARKQALHRKLETGSDHSTPSPLPEQRAVPNEVSQDRAQDQRSSVHQQKVSTVTRPQQANEEYEDVFPLHKEEKQIGVQGRTRIADVQGGHFEVQAIVHSEDWTHAGQHSGRGQKILHSQAVKKHVDQQRTVTSQQTGHVNTYIKPRISHLCPSPTIDQEVRGINQEDVCICLSLIHI